MKRFVAIAAVLSLAGGCAIDTELGLDATIDSTSVEVRAAAEGDVVAVRMALSYRVGAHAPESHELMPQAIDVFAGDALVATVAPDRPPMFRSVVQPGQSFATTFTGESTPSATTDPRRLCDGSARLLFRWVDASSGELGMAEGSTSEIACD